jgi:hypothetical protein
MQDVAEVICPYCGEVLQLYFEEDLVGQLVQDCDVCCRPMTLYVQHSDDGELMVSIDRAQ